MIRLATQGFKEGTVDSFGFASTVPTVGIPISEASCSQAASYGFLPLTASCGARDDSHCLDQLCEIQQQMFGILRVHRRLHILDLIINKMGERLYASTILFLGCHCSHAAGGKVH